MADTIRKVEYYKITVPDRAGEGAKVLGPLWEAGVNLLAFTGFPEGKRAQLDFIPENSKAFEQVAKNAKVKIGKKKTCFLIQGENRSGAIANIESKLGQSKINSIALTGVSAGEGRYGAILWVKPRDTNKAAKILGAT